MSIFSGRSGQDTQEFWRGLEESLGTPIRGYALGRYLSGGGVQGPLWGLLYVTETALFFHHFAQSNWFSAIVDHGRSPALSVDTKPKGASRRTEPARGGGVAEDNFSKSADGSITIEMGLHRGRVLEVSKVSGWRAWLSGVERETYRLVDEFLPSVPFTFTVEQRDSRLVCELRTILVNKRPPGNET